jgi:hypothetical protein
MPVYILLLIAAAPVLTMAATAGDAFGREARVVALIALTIILSTVVAWLVAAAVRTVPGIWRHMMPRPYTRETTIYRSESQSREDRLR